MDRNGNGIFNALTYVLMAQNVFSISNLQMDEKPAGIIYFAAGCYLVGGLVAEIAQILLEVALTCHCAVVEKRKK